MFPISRRILLALLLVAASGFDAFAQPMAEPDGAVVLTITEAEADPVRLDRAMLAALPATTYRTTTIWTEGTQAFTGVTLQALMERIGAKGQTLRAYAINDYAIDIPWSDVTNGVALLAYARNGKAMSVREKGPLWIVYPYDSDRVFRQGTFHARSIWQLDRIDVLP